MYDIGSLRHVGLGGAALVLGVFAGCGSTVTSGNQGGAGGSDVSSSSSSGNAGMGGAGGSVVSVPALAMNKLLLGDTDPDGTPNPTQGWKLYGFDLDGRESTKTSMDLCQPAAGGSVAAVYPDGNGGIDNSFGKNILPILLGLASDLSIVNNEAIANGERTYLLAIADADKLPPTTSSALFLGGNLGAAPKFDGSDVWPIDASSLLDPSKPSSAKCAFTNTTIDMGIVRAGPPSQFDLILSVTGIPMVIPIQHATMLFASNADLTSADSGQIGGIIRTEDLTTAIAKVAAAFDSSFCDPSSPTLQSILNQMRQASDIMQDGTQDPSKECDGISIGLGFTMKSVKLGAIAPLPPPPPDPCAAP